mmetsp:Transcript_21894/g.62813  ORF Transcript_21894/g.62813 Transcript_21894/m.62813 type:complete len:418 (-) Transcript_21894:2161-3414(-)
MRFLTSFLCMTTSSVASAYDFIVTSKGGFYEAITDASGTQIGERFQNPAINASGDRIGTSQGFAYNFAPDTSSDPANRNWIFFLDDGQIEVMDQAIVGATGSYEKYTGGEVSQNIASVDPDYVSEITLLEPGTSSAADKTQQIHETLKITAEGGFFLSFSSPSGEQIGEMFQNPIFVKNTTTGEWERSIGSISQGFGYNFAPGPYSDSSYVGNRLVFLPGGELTVCDDAIVQGTGAYSKYTGGSIKENVTSLHPNFVAEITLNEKEPYADHLVNPAEVTLFPNDNSAEAIQKPILNSTGAPIGVRLQLPVENQDGAPLGTMLAYAYLFPNPAGQTRNGNRHLFLKDGDLTIFNDIIVHATGIYAGYAGGRAPTSESDHKITLIPPQTIERHSAGKQTKASETMSVLLVVALVSFIWL